MLFFRSLKYLAAGAALNMTLLVVPLIWSPGLTEQADLHPPSAFHPLSDQGLTGLIQRFTDGRGQDWFRLTPTSATAGHSVLRLDSTAFPEGCLIEWFSTERNALRVCTGNDETTELPFCGALKSQAMQIIQRGTFPPDWLSQGVNLGVYSLPGAGVFFRVIPAPIKAYQPFRPAVASGSLVWQIGVWLSSVWVVAGLISRYAGSGQKRFALLALAYTFLLGFLFFERPFDGMAGSIDHDDDSYYTAYTQNLINHKSLFSAPTELNVGRPVIQHNHGLPGTALFLAPAVWLYNAWEHRPFTSPIDLPALRWMRLASATYSLLATVLLFLAAHQIAVSGWNVPVAAFLISGTSLAKWTYQRSIFTHSIELMLLCGIILLAIWSNRRGSAPSLATPNAGRDAGIHLEEEKAMVNWMGPLAGVLLGGLCLVRGEYLLAIPIIPFLFRFGPGQPLRVRVIFAGSFLLAVLPFVLFYRHAVGQLTTGYGSLAGSTLAPHRLSDWWNLDFWQALGHNIWVLFQSYWESGVILFFGVIALLTLPSKGPSSMLPKVATGLFMATFLLATAFFPLPLGSEWQHRYSLKLYPFALLAILAWRARSRHVRSAHLVLAAAFLFSLMRQFSSFEVNQREIAGTGMDTAKWIFSDVQLLTRGLSDTHYATLHWSMVMITVFWMALALIAWRRSRSFKWWQPVLGAAGLLIIGALAWRAPFWLVQEGLEVTYFQGSDFQQPICRRLEPRICSDYGFQSPATGVGRHDYSARWQGSLRVPETGTYTFFAESGGGLRIRLGDVWLIDNWKNSDWRGSGRKVTLPLKAGVYPLKVEHGVRNGPGALRLRWDGGPIPEGSIVGAPYVRRH
ncbi:MAG: PA14 domain-containing protein [bacterium]